MSGWVYTYHKFDDRDAFLATAVEAGAFYVHETMYHPSGLEVDEVGVLFSPPVLDGEGNELEPSVLLPGYHINCAWPDDMHPAFAASQIFPQAPQRRWAT